MAQTIAEQNAMISKQQVEAKSARDILVRVYAGVVKYKTEFSSDKTAVETTSYPDVRMEDLNKLTMPDLYMNIAKTFKATTDALTETREEINTIYKELDEHVDNALDEWERIKTQENSQNAKGAFREGLLSSAAEVRTKTPELPLPPKTPMGNDKNLSVLTPDSSDQGKARKEAASKQKSGTTTLEEALKSPTTPTTKTAKPKAKA